MAQLFWANVLLWSASAAFGFGTTSLGKWDMDVQGTVTADTSVRIKDMSLARVDAGLRDVITERPLFEPGRRPVSLSRPAEAPAGQATAELVLLGVGGFADRLVAVIDTGAAQPVRLSEGDDVGGWRIDAVTGDRVTLSRNGDKKVLVLSASDGSGRKRSGAGRAVPGGADASVGSSTGWTALIESQSQSEYE